METEVGLCVTYGVLSFQSSCSLFDLRRLKKMTKSPFCRFPDLLLTGCSSNAGVLCG